MDTTENNITLGNNNAWLNAIHHTGEKAKSHTGEKPTYANKTSGKQRVTANASQMKNVKDDGEKSFTDCSGSESDESETGRKKDKYKEVIVIRETIKTIHVKDVETQCTNDVETQTVSDAYQITGKQAVAELLNHIGQTLTISNGKPYFSCKEIAEKLSILAGIPTDADWVLNAFKQ